jgi:serine/threonine protein kinase
MTKCRLCSAEATPGSLLCATCGAGSGSPTVAMPAAARDDGRFSPGTLLADRYRIVGLLGAGGMGVVYRADDLKLGQPVALKFLPTKHAINEQMLARFYGEVRMARQVSHPNVCRVYDIGEVDGAAYISMEYIDGEDLASLLRRIGRLPADKALEVARKLCAGLTAAHNKGVLHRDLKPANIMIDGRGQVLITDFGLAAAAGQAQDIRSGTPAYMSPEQLRGQEVTVQSDIYSLGLVLYEVFTGARAYVDQERTKPPSIPSSVVKDIEPSVEKAIQRCLEPESRNRPASALAVAAALPRWDGLAAAMAAGETPSPDLVAEAGQSEAPSIRMMALCLALVLLGLVGVAFVGEKANLLSQTPMQKSQEELAARSRQLIQQFGYKSPSFDSAQGFDYDSGFLRYVRQRETSTVLRAQLAKGQPAPIFFWYRQHDSYLWNSAGVIRENDPSGDRGGMIDVNLDPEGRLVYFAANPHRVEEAAGDPPPAADWAAVLAAAGIDASRFTPAKPRLVFAHAFDTRVAWTGTFPHAPEVTMRVEATSWKGRLASFEIMGPWAESSFRDPSVQLQERIRDWFSLAIEFLVFATAILLAWRNTRLGRGDTRGAGRLTLFVLACIMLAWLCRASHHAVPGHYDQMLVAVGDALCTAGAFGVLYLALEPYLRRSWPHALIGWTRLISSGLRDPMAAGQCLIGAAMGVAGTILFYTQNMLIEPAGSIQFGPVTQSLDWLMGVRQIVANITFLVPNIAGVGLFHLFVLFLFRVAFRRDWLAGLVVVGLGSAYYSAGSPRFVLAVLFLALADGWAVFVVLRKGVLPLIVMMGVSIILAGCPMSTDFSSPYATGPIVALGSVLVFAAYCFRSGLAGRPLIKEGFLEN